MKTTRLGLCLALALAGAVLESCSGQPLDAVRPAGGLYRPNAGCTLSQEGGAQCPSHAQFTFETDAFGGFTLDRSGNLDGLGPSCHHSFCGTGSLRYHMTYRWPAGAPASVAEATRIGTLSYRFGQPVDLWGKTLTVKVLVDAFTTPMNGLIGVVEPQGTWHLVDDHLLTGGWNTIGAPIAAENKNLKVDSALRSFPIIGFDIQVYLSVPVRSGTEDWEGDAYLDDLQWQ